MHMRTFGTFACTLAVALVAANAWRALAVDLLAETTALRLEAKPQSGWSAGILEWQVEEPKATIDVDVRSVGRPVSKYLAGACIEDVNHEIYGGLYSQMIFGESFQEPPLRTPAKGFAAFDGEWRLDKGEMLGSAGDGPKLVAADVVPFADGSAGVEVFLPADATKDTGVRNAGLILRVARPGSGADDFDGYEIALDAGRKVICVGRHRHNYKHLKGHSLRRADRSLDRACRRR